MFAIYMETGGNGQHVPIAWFLNWDDAVAYVKGSEEYLGIWGDTPPADNYSGGYAYACGYHD